MADAAVVVENVGDLARSLVRAALVVEAVAVEVAESFRVRLA